MTLDELLLEWSYRSEKGYPSLGNPSDMLVLEKILKGLDIPSEEIIQYLKEEDEKPKNTSANTEYDQLIATVFDGEIPKSKNTYKFTKSTFDEQVKADDLEIWKKLWTIKPKKKTGDQTETLGVGKGELSLYWLYNHSNSSTAGKLAEGRGDDAPDLWFGGDGTDGVEVKAYGKPNGVIDLGRFGKFRDNLKILNLIFGLKGLASVFDGTVKDQKQINALSWAGSDLKEAFETVVTFSEVDLKQLYPEPFPIFEQFDKNIQFIESALGEFNTAEEGAKLMAKKFVGDKLARKPGYGGHLADMSISGFIRFWHIDKNKFDSYDDILGKATVGASQGAMKLHFNKIFG